MKTMLITGGAGFIGQFLVRKFVNSYKVVCIVRDTTDLSRLADVKDRVTFVKHNIQDSYDSIFEQLKDVSVILHAGANPSSESSIKDPVSVVLDNVLGTTHLLELARKLPIERFVYYSAAEVFGPIAPGTDSKEDDRYWSNSPYAASKAGGEELCLAYSNTFNIPVSVIHITNTFGERCQTNRYPVVAIRKILNNIPIDIHVGANNSIGGRKWFYAGDVADHTEFVIVNQ
jgi:dTDP-glucose 4,6-dehydratase